MPITVIVVALGADWISVVIIADHVPLIPDFMGLAGQSTKEKMGRQAAMLARLAGHFLDAVAGLPIDAGAVTPSQQAHNRRARLQVCPKVNIAQNSQSS